MKTGDFDFVLPPELIAQTPSEKRSASRLFLYNRESGERRHGRFHELLDLIPAGDLLVLNASRVLPARLFTRVDPEKKPAEIFFLRLLSGGVFEALVRPGRRFREGARHELPGNAFAIVTKVNQDGTRILKVENLDDPLPLFRQHGEMPLPPYITSRVTAPERYQTVFARDEGSVAAPTAGLHFDEELLVALEKKGVLVCRLHLHVGLGTFKPIETEDIEDHRLHAERFDIPEDLARTFGEVRGRGGKVWACGTTSVRSLESAVQADGRLRVGPQETQCYITPGHVFRAVDHLITNFHLPRSSLLVLVSAFCGRETVLKLYQEAVEHRYRFFSFGDAMVFT